MVSGRPTISPRRFDLTARQVEVMELIEAGKTNFEIAEHLGVSLDGAKYHVREILSKLGVANREEAVAAWRSGRTARRWRWLGSSLGAAKLAALAAGFVVLAAIAGGLITWAVTRDGSEQPVTPPPTATASAAPSPSASPTGSPTPSATPETIIGIEVQPLRLGEDVPLPENVALYIETGCWQCDGPAASLERVYRAPDGSLRWEDIFRLPGATVTQPTPGDRYIASIALERGGDDILIAVCDEGYCGDVGEISEDAVTAFHWSGDGGITWTSKVRIPGGAWIRANYGGGPPGSDGFGVISRAYRAEPGAAYTNELAYYPTLETQPIELRGQEPNLARIFDPAEGPALLLGADGLTLFRLEGSPTNPPQYGFSGLPAGSRLVDFQFSAGGIMVTWVNEDTGGMYTGFGQQGESLTAIYRWPSGSEPFFHRPQGGFLDATTFLVAISGGNGVVPAIIDFKTATIHAISALADRDEPSPRLLVRGVNLGPFARVSGAGEGDCLNVRVSPTLSAEPFACYPDGVLLRELGSETSADGQEWVFVESPLDRRQGWASAEFLEVSGDAPTLNLHPAGTRTGNPLFDTAIAAVEGGDPLVIEQLISWSVEACAPFEGFGGPPECPEGAAEGTELEVLSGAACHGYWRLRPEPGSGVSLAVQPTARLYAVVEREDGDEYPPGTYALIYAMPDSPEMGQAVYLDAEGRIVGDWGGCGVSPPDIVARGGTVVFGPP
jgi:DNA-binding CsgD family transcriptional regulator